MVDEVMKPFRAWVAWHPDNPSRSAVTAYGSWFDAVLFLPDSVVRSLISSVLGEGCDVIASVLASTGWRIVEVEVRPITKLDYRGVDVELETTPRGGE